MKQEGHLSVLTSIKLSLSLENDTHCKSTHPKCTFWYCCFAQQMLGNSLASVRSSIQRDWKQQGLTSTVLQGSYMNRRGNFELPAKRNFGNFISSTYDNNDGLYQPSSLASFDPNYFDKGSKLIFLPPRHTQIIIKKLKKRLGDCSKTASILNPDLDYEDMVPLMPPHKRGASEDFSARSGPLAAWFK